MSNAKRWTPDEDAAWFAQFPATTMIPAGTGPRRTAAQRWRPPRVHPDEPDEAYEQRVVADVEAKTEYRR